MAPGATPWMPSRPARADEDAGELGAVPLDLAPVLRVRAGPRPSPVPPTMSIPGSTRPPRYGCERSTPVSRSAIVMPDSVEARERDRRERPTSSRRGGRRDRRRVGDPHRVDAGDLRVVLEQRDRARVEHGREAVEDARVAVVGADGRGRGGRAGSAPAAAPRRPRPSSAARPASVASFAVGDALGDRRACAGRRSSGRPAATAGRAEPTSPLHEAAAGSRGRRRREAASGGR